MKTLISFDKISDMKQYKTKSELIAHLQSDRNIVVPTEKSEIFDNFRYGEIIDAYKDVVASNILSNNKHIYSEGTSLDDFINLFNIDCTLSMQMVLYITYYEKRLKKFISDKVCESMKRGGSNDCCDYSFFEKMKDDVSASYLDCFVPLSHEYDNDGKKVIASSKTIERRTHSLEKILNLVTGKNESELNYYIIDYYHDKNAIPFYILIGNISFSNLIIIFEMFDKDIQLSFLKTVLKRQNAMVNDIKPLSSKHNVIRIIRNIVHHHEPLLPFLCKIEYIDFDTKKASISLLKGLYDSTKFVDKVTIASNYDVSKIENYQSRKAKKILSVLKLVK